MWRPKIRKYLKDYEIDNLKSAISMPKYRLLVDILLLSGRRITEVLHLKVEDIDYKNKRIAWEIEKKGRKKTKIYISTLNKHKKELGLTNRIRGDDRLKLINRAVTLARKELRIVCTCEAGGDLLAFTESPVIKLKPAGDRLLKILKYYSDSLELENGDYLFTGYGRLKHLTRYATFSYLTKAAGIAGIESKKINNHAFRHTVAFKMSDSGVPDSAIQFLLDHSDRNTTASYGKMIGEDVRKYLHVLEE